MSTCQINIEITRPKVAERIEKKLLHYVGKAVADFNLIEHGDRVMVCLSGGKDSFTMLTILNKLRARANIKFDLFAFTLDQSQPGWDDSQLRAYMDRHNYKYEILTRDTYSVVKEKLPEGATYCSLCSRLRRGIIYSYAKEHGYNKIALGHHRDDLITTLLMSIFYSGQIKSMPPKLLSDDKQNLIIRPLVYCQEADIIKYAAAQQYPIIPCNLCGSQDNLMRVKVKRLIADLARDNPKVPSNILNALTNVQPSQLMDRSLWDFKGLQSQIHD